MQAWTFNVATVRYISSSLVNRLFKCVARLHFMHLHNMIKFLHWSITENPSLFYFVSLPFNELLDVLMNVRIGFVSIIVRSRMSRQVGFGL